MSRFSEQCKELIRENGTNVYRMSKEFSLEVTALQRMVTGKRLPNIDFVKKFCECLRIPETEKSTLLELYKIEQVGENTYYSRKCIKQLFSRLYGLEHEEEPFRENHEDPAPSFSIHTHMSLGVETALLAILEHCFCSEKEEQIYTNFPAGDSSLFHYLNILRMRHGNNVSISHLINFRIDSFHSLSNLNALLQILPFTMSSNIRYTPYFVYSRAGHTDFQSQLFPYYLITDDSVLLCSGDFSKHIVLKDHEAVTAYINAFDHALKQAHLLIRSSSDPIDAWQHYQEIVASKDMEVFGIEPQICYTGLMDRETFMCFQAEMVPGLSPIFSEFTQKLWDQNKVFYFTQDGMDLFCETGQFTGQVTALLPPVQRENVIAMLEHYLSSEQGQHGYLLKNRIRFPLHINFEINGNHHLNIIQITPDGQFNMLTICESSVCEAFRDFALSLQEDEDVCSVAETRQFIQEKIDMLKKAGK